jgi:hypothetical protein
VDKINKIKRLGFWIFIIPFISVNICLILSQSFEFREFDVPSPGNYYGDWKIFNIGDAIADKSSEWLIPYVDGSASISRVVRVYPVNIIFKLGMFITGFLLIKYWLLNKRLIIELKITEANTNKMVFFGICSAVLLIIHSIFLGIKYDIAIYKLFRRIILLLFIFMEITAQFYLIKLFYKNKDIIKKLININVLNIKKVLVYSLILVAIAILPFLPFANLKILKHALEWDYFLGVITFYLLTFFLWKKI